MKTRIHTYYFNLERPEDREPYHQLQARLKATPGRGHWMNAWDPGDVAARAHAERIREHDGQEITLEPEHLFENQWNSKECGRVFDWYEGINPNNRLLKFGHYLDITDEMRSIRRETLKCGYTGMQFPASAGLKFNTSHRALGSEYLKESELHLLRLLPIDQEWRTQRAPLTDEERAYLLPLYIKAQTEGSDSTREKAKAAVRKEYEDATREATTKRDGFLWCMERGIPTENLIYYSHTDAFCFGWRSPFSPEAAEVLRDKLNGFPFAVEIKGLKQSADVVGTCYFPIKANALRYYRETEGGDVVATVEQKLAAGEIHIGKPPMKPGQTLFVQDLRYHIRG